VDHNPLSDVKDNLNSRVPRNKQSDETKKLAIILGLFDLIETSKSGESGEED
jgi:hypothetical protein